MLNLSLSSDSEEGQRLSQPESEKSRKSLRKVKFEDDYPVSDSEKDKYDNMTKKTRTMQRSATQGQLKTIKHSIRRALVDSSEL